MINRSSISLFRHLKNSANYLLALTSLFELLHQHGHFIFVYTALSGQNFIEYHLAVKLSVVCMFGLGNLKNQIHRKNSDSHTNMTRAYFQYLIEYIRRSALSILWLSYSNNLISGGIGISMLLTGLDRLICILYPQLYRIPFQTAILMQFPRLQPKYGQNGPLHYIVRSDLFGVRLHFGFLYCKGIFRSSQRI